MKRIAAALFLASTLSFAPVLGAEVAVAGRPVHFDMRGKGETIIFVHGWTCDARSWSAQMRAFAPGRRVIALDLPGHGKSALPVGNRFSLALFADAVEAVRSQVGADRVVLVGHSMGAAVIRHYALRFPDRVAGLVAVDGPLDSRPLVARAGSLPPLTQALRKRMIENMFVPGTPRTVRSWRRQ